MPSIKKQKNKKQQTKNTYFGTLFKNGLSDMIISVLMTPQILSVDTMIFVQ
jgi:hypothetical protein